MINETIIWTAIPAGRVGGKAKLSVHAVFQLNHDQAEPIALSKFPFTSAFDPTTLSFQILVNGTPISSTITKSTDAVKGLWQSYFVPDGPVISFTPPPKVPKISTFHAMGVGSYLIQMGANHAVAGFSPAVSASARFSDPLLQKAMLNPPKPPAVSQARFQSLVTRPQVNLESIQSARKLGKAPTDQSAHLLEMSEYLKPFPLRPHLPADPTLDFHQAIAMLGQYQGLMRKMGIVIDVEFDATGLAGDGKVSVRVNGIAESDALKMHYPSTAFTAADFRPKSQDSGPNANMIGGMMNMSTDKVTLGTFDLAGSTVQTVAFAEGIAYKHALIALKLTALSKVGGQESPPASTAVGPMTTLSEKDELPPVTRTTGISLYQINRVVHFTTELNRSHALYMPALLANPTPGSLGDPECVLYAEDLLKGWRPDIQKEGKWYSLTSRTLSCKVGSQTIALTEEGQVSSATSSSPDGSGDTKVGESLFTWRGWSLTSPKPGASLADNGSLLTADKTRSLDPHYKLDVVDAPSPRSLPTLRFGESYTVRVRAVDLAGNSYDLAAVPSGAPTQGTLYLRHDPILSPTLHLNEDPTQRGDSPYVLVVRKYQGKATTENATRFILPPLGGVAYAEEHGLLDTPQGSPDPNMYSILAREGSSELPEKMSGSPSVLPYLADPTSSGATFRVASNFPLPPAMTSFYSKSKWPNPEVGTLKLSGGPATSMKGSEKELDISLQPGQRLTLYLSSNTSGEYLGDFFQTWALVNAHPNLGSRLATQIHPQFSTRFSKRISLHPEFRPFGFKPVSVTAAAPDPGDYLNGFNSALTPYRYVEVVHATQVPEPGFAAVAFGASRPAGKTYATFDFAGKVHGWSTQAIEYDAAYTDMVDDLSEPRRKTTQVAREAKLFSFPIPYIDPEPINNLRRQGQFEFHDTKCHILNVNMVAISRYQEFFVDNGSSQFAISYPYKNPVVVPSSAKPSAVAIEYAMPVFLWTESDSSGQQMSSRKGNMLRVYLRRPWFVSGNDEQLAVVLMRGLTGAEGDPLARHATLVGGDPTVIDSNTIGAELTPNNFPGAVSVSGFSPPEAPNAVADLAVFTPQFDENLQMWYADVEIRPDSPAYLPFVRLALARYQPHSLPGLEMGPITTADIMQLQPDRSATLQVVQPGKQIRISCTGYLGRTQSGPNTIIGTLEHKVGPRPDMGWAPVLNSDGEPYEFQVPMFLPQRIGRLRLSTATSPQGSPTIAGIPQATLVNLPDPSQTYRIVLREFEIRPQGQRLVHADTIQIR